MSQEKMIKGMTLPLKPEMIKYLVSKSRERGIYQNEGWVSPLSYKIYWG